MWASSWKRFRGQQLASSRPRNRPPKPTMLRADVPRSFWLDVGPGEEGDGPLPPLYGWLNARWLARGVGDARGRSRNRRWLWRGHRVSMYFGSGRTQEGPASARVLGYHGRQAVRLNGGWGSTLGECSHCTHCTHRDPWRRSSMHFTGSRGS